MTRCASREGGMDEGRRWKQELMMPLSTCAAAVGAAAAAAADADVAVDYSKSLVDLTK